MRYQNLTLLAVWTVIAVARADSPASGSTAPEVWAFSTQTCELGVTEADAYTELANLRAQIDALEASGALSSGRANALRNHVDNAVRRLDAGLPCPALAQLGAFREQITNFVAEGVLSEMQASPLLESINEVLDGPISRAPIALNDAYEVNEDTILTVVQPGVLENDIDTNGAGLTVLLVSGPSIGGLTIMPDGSFRYIPYPDFCGTEQFTYRAYDGTAASNVATVTVAVHPIDDPDPVDDSCRVLAGAQLPVNPRQRS
jgi:hypothetical protein